MSIVPLFKTVFIHCVFLNIGLFKDRIDSFKTLWQNSSFAELLSKTGLSIVHFSLSLKIEVFNETLSLN